jgi:hypothetical protein
LGGRLFLREPLLILLVVASILSGTGLLWWATHPNNVVVMGLILIILRTTLVILACINFWCAIKGLGGLVAKPFWWLFVALIGVALGSIQLIYFFVDGFDKAIFVIRVGLPSEAVVVGLILLHASLLLKYAVGGGVVKAKTEDSN